MEKVIARLESKGISKSPLIDEWTAIRETTSQERAFCETTGALGLDPYDLDEDKADEIVLVSERLPGELRREFFLAADSALIKQQAKWVRKCLHGVERLQKRRRNWLEKRGLFWVPSSASTPWQTGYQLARKFRADFKLGKQLKKRVDIGKLLGGQLPVYRIGDENQFDAVTKLSNDVGPQVATSKKREKAARAICLRGQYAIIYAHPLEESALLTRVRIRQTKNENRAFAKAELLAPADGIRQLLSGSRTTRDEIAEIADLFKAS